jgi:catechol 2,3-dioxygenase-like lactoylglutathione lyase family enzyme
VTDVDRSASCCAEVFGFEVVLRQVHEVVLLQTPGAQDSLALCRAPRSASGRPRRRSGVIDHVGLRIHEPTDVDEIVAVAVACGGRLLEPGARGGDGRHAFIVDPDGAVNRL